MFPEGKQMRRHQTLKNGYEYEVSMNVNKMGNPCNGPVALELYNISMNQTCIYPRNTTLNKKACPRLRELNLNGQLAFYGPDELLSALCNKI